MLQYEIKSEDISLSYVFSKLEDAHRALHIEDYSVSQNTLDNVSNLQTAFIKIYMFIIFNFHFNNHKTVVNLGM